MSGGEALSQESSSPAAGENRYLNHVNHSLSSGVASLHLQEGFRDFREREGLFNNRPNLQTTGRDPRVNKKADGFHGGVSVCGHPARLRSAVRGSSFPPSPIPSRLSHLTLSFTLTAPHSAP